MPATLQIPPTTRTLSNAVFIHLADFASKYEDDFSYVRDIESSGVEYFSFRFARVIPNPFNRVQEDLGFIRLRRLNRDLTEIFIEDAAGADIGPDLFLWTNARVSETQDQDEEVPIPLKRRQSNAAILFERFKTLHQEVRETIIEGLRRDHLLLGEQKAATPSSQETYVDKTTIARLRQVRSRDFDLQRLIRLCEELNKCSAAGTFCATAA